MKISIRKRPEPTGEENEAVIYCDEEDAEVLSAVRLLEGAAGFRLTGTDGGHTVILRPENILYFESVDGRVFAYGKDQVWQVPKSLDALEAALEARKFFRISKASLVNLDRVAYLESAMGNRMTATMENGEKLVISRHYARILRAYLKE